MEQLFFHRPHSAERAVNLTAMRRFKISLQRIDQTGSGTAAQNM
jgi:hypothetical protein